MNRRLSVPARGRPISALRHATPHIRTIICARLLSAAAFAGVLFAGASLRAADLSKDIRTATDITPFKAIIAQNVLAQVTKLKQDDDPKNASNARESLVDEVRGLVDPSPAFLDAYEAELQTQLTPLLSNTASSIRVRLNAAIVVADVAARSQDAQLAQLVVTELNDPSEAVVLWGLKAAHEVIPPALGVPSLKVKLIAAVTAAAQKFGTGPIMTAAYNALAVSDKPPASPVDLIAPMQALLGWRIQQYAGTIPPEPPADARATGFLTERNVWLVQTPAQQKTTAQLITDLVGAASVGLASAQPDDRDQLTVLLRKTGEAIYVIGITTADQALKDGSTPLTKVDQRPPPLPPLAAAAAAVNALAAKISGLHIPKGFPAATVTPAAVTPVKPAP